MKYAVKNSGTFEFGGRATDNGHNVFKNVLDKLFSKKKDEKSSERPEKVTGGIEGNSTLKWEIEGSLDISVEEMAELFKLNKENDLHCWELIKKMGADFIKGSEKLLYALKAQGPEWIEVIGLLDDKANDIEHRLEVQSFKRERETEDEISRSGWTRRGKNWYERSKEAAEE